MATSFAPYTYIQCPCSDETSVPPASKHEPSSRPSSSGHDNQAAGEQDEDDRTFDPRAPRANYSLYPLEYLLYCEDCHQIRCPRCVAEEIATYYCPNCLFEVPTSNLKSEGNRCTRSCFQCPVCVAPLTVTSLETPSSSAHLAVPDGAAPHPRGYVLNCSYCQWSSTEIGIKFDKANGLYSQLTQVRNGGKPRPPPPGRDGKRRDLSMAPSLSAIGTGIHAGGTVSVSAAAETEKSSDSHGGDRAEGGLDVESQFSNLKQFYERQLTETNGAGLSGLSSFGDLGFGSPASLSRIMSMYTSGMAGNSTRFDKKAQSRVRSMREARDETEGFQPAELDESAAIARLQHNATTAWDTTASLEQQVAQAPFVGGPQLHGRARFLDELRPIPFLLRTKRSKRCPICRHIISKPDTKSSSNRFRIRLVAGSYIPSISIRPLNSGGAAATAPVTGSKTGSSSIVAAAASPSSQLLEPLKPVQYILTFKNPIFESVKVTLATPSTTSGRFASKVTVLCPQFEIDSNTDVWDDALRDTGGAGGGSTSGSGRSRRDEGLSQQQQQQQQAVAGKIWERGRNWVSIVVEVVPPSLNLDLLAMTSKPLGGGSAPNGGKIVDLGPLREDEDVVEIPMSVRVEWETDPAQDAGVSSGRDRDGKEKRELSYWCVLGLGRIRQE